MFAQNGFQGTSTEALLTKLQISRGALYHHFPSKEDLFAAVLDEVEADVLRWTDQAAEGIANPAERLASSFDAFLELAGEDEVRQIILTDALGVLGWRRWRDLEEQHGLGRLKQGLTSAAAHGLIPTEMVNVYSHILIGALTESAYLVATAEDRASALFHAKIALRKVIDGLFKYAGNKAE